MEIQHVDTSQVDNQTLETHVSRLSSYRDELKQTLETKAYNSPESLLRLPSDSEILTEVRESVQAVTNGQQPSDVILVGAGGSSRSAQAVYDLLADELPARLHVFDTLSTNEFTALRNTFAQESIDLADVAICVVSKSGETVETIANVNTLLGELRDVFPASAVADRTVVVSKSDSQLAQLAREHNLQICRIPEQIPGRFSAFSPAGLLPLALAGCDIKELTEGGVSLRSACLSGRPLSDPAAVLAAILFAHMEDSIRIINHSFSTPQAASLSSWITQLFSESLSKRTNQRGEPIFSGVQPTTTILPRDLHADLQLQLGGPKNFFTLFVRETQSTGDLNTEIRDAGLLPDSQQTLAGRSRGALADSLIDSVMTAFRETGRPYIEISVPHFNTKSIGQFLLLEQLIVVYLGELLDINTFNQPQVDAYKAAVQKKLSDE